MKNSTVTIFDLVEQLKPDLWVSGHYSLCEAHITTARSVYNFCDCRFPTLRELFTKDFLHRYQARLIHMNRKRNTISYYMSVLRSLYREAVKLRKVRYNPDLFSDIFTGSDPTEKRAVNPGIIGFLATADLSEIPRLERCRDFFILSFLLQGMPFVDLAHLKKSDIQSEAVIYRRTKTGAPVIIPLQNGIRFLLTKYSDEVSESPYALPILDPDAANPRCCYKNALRKQNRQLEALADYLDMDDHLTTYVARHSWATIAHHSDVAIGVVSQAMGHQSEEVTRAYLRSFGHDHLLAAGNAVLNAILNPVLKNKMCSKSRLRELGLMPVKVNGNAKRVVGEKSEDVVIGVKHPVYKGVTNPRAKNKKCPSTRD